MKASKILIVEDETIVQLHLRRIATGLGHAVTGTAGTMSEALAAAELEPPELVLMDIHLADGSDGVDTAQRLRDRFDCAVLFVTAYADEDTVRRTEAVGAAGYLVKPFSDVELRASISAALTAFHRFRETRANQRSLVSILGDRADGLFVTDSLGFITYANRSAVVACGWSEDLVVGRHLAEIIKAADEGAASELHQALTAAAQLGRPRALGSYPFVSRSGDWASWPIDVEPIADAASDAPKLLVTLRVGEPRTAVAEPLPTKTAPFGEAARLLVYSHDTFGLGHLRRSLKLIGALAARNPRLSTLLVTGSPLAHRYGLPQGADYVKLPAVRKVAPESYESRSLAMPDDGVLGLRSELLLRTIRDYDPNVLLVDHAPLGMNGEILPALEWLKARGACTRILGMRDIVDDPVAVLSDWADKGMHSALEEHYDHVLVYGAPEVFDPVEAYEFPAAVAAKTRFVHYVHDAAAAAPTTSAAIDTPALIVVSAGGGDGGVQPMVDAVLEVLELHGSELDVRVEIITGPLVDTELQASLRDKVQGLPVTLQSFVPSPAECFERADLVICTGGYNTTVEVLGFAKRAIIVPRTLHRQEQLMRARRLEELGLVTCMPPETLSTEALRAEIERLLQLPVGPLVRGRSEQRVGLDGAERFADFCAELQVPVPLDWDARRPDRSAD